MLFDWHTICPFRKSFASAFSWERRAPARLQKPRWSVALPGKTLGNWWCIYETDMLVAGRALRKTISRCAWEVGFEAGVLIQTVVMSREEAEQGPEQSSLLMLAIREEGIPV